MDISAFIEEASAFCVHAQTLKTVPFLRGEFVKVHKTNERSGEVFTVCPSSVGNEVKIKYLV